MWAMRRSFWATKGGMSPAVRLHRCHRQSRGPAADVLPQALISRACSWALPPHLPYWSSPRAPQRHSAATELQLPMGVSRHPRGFDCVPSRGRFVPNHAVGGHPT